ncbi:MAG TPA: GEVED domain-containing protein [Ferruginibacter sp.]|nr:GEVED domain-containing protein [Ferruginibacter sp.]HMP19492.1 GEVED domain-containing protein [Ferruginibacter sp.]
MKCLLQRGSVLALIFLLNTVSVFSQSASVFITTNIGTSQIVPLGTGGYSISESIYTAAEIGAGTFGANPINRVDFSTLTISDEPVYENVRIYMRNVASTVNAFVGNANYSTSGYTEVFNGTIAFTDTGFTGVNLTTAFNYVSTGNLQMMVVRGDGINHFYGTFYAAQGNHLSSTALTNRRYNSNTPFTTSSALTNSSFKPAVRLSYVANGAPPLCAPYPWPENNDTDIPTNVTLAWSQAVGATSYDIYLGTTTPAPFVLNKTTINYKPASNLLPNTRYYYRIVARNANGAAVGCTERSFTTGAGFEYCFPFYTTGCTLGDGITLFRLGDINNASTCSNSAYSDFTYLSSNLTQGQSYPLTINQQDEDFVKVWIDFNDDGNFGENELVFGSASDNNVGTAVTGTVTIPANAPTGLHLMRVRNSYVSNDFDACSILDFGEAEDYAVNIITSSTLDAALTDLSVSACQGAGIINVTLKNTGGVPIAAGAATVRVFVKGANPQGPLNQTNPAPLAAGQSVVLSYPASFPVAGENIDSAFIVKIAGDVNPFNDTLLTGHLTVGVINAPMAEDFEGNVDGWTVTQIAGEGNWLLTDTVYYPDFEPMYTLTPKSGEFAALFDSYSNEAGTISRLSSPCISLPGNAGSGCGYVAGFYFTQDAQYINPDSVVLRITTGDGTYTRLGVAKRQDTTLSTSDANAPFSRPVWKLYTFDVADFAGETVQFALDAYGNFGNMMAVDSFFVGPKTTTTNLSLAGGNESGIVHSRAIVACDDKGWTYYHTPNSADYIFSIQWDPGNTGANAAAKAAATSTLIIDRSPFAAENPATQKATYTMQRYWDINLNGATLTAPVNVRFFYSQREMDSIIAAKNRFIAAHPGSVDKGISWFKKNNGAFVPATDVTPDGVTNATAIANTNTINATINGVLYAQFNDITSFSGGTAAAGVGPVPAAITYTFTGNGSWSVAANWSNNTVPPATLPAGSSIIINHAVGGQCILNITQNIAAGASLTVLTGKNLIIPGQLNIQ